LSRNKIASLSALFTTKASLYFRIKSENPTTDGYSANLYMIIVFLVLRIKAFGVLILAGIIWKISLDGRPFWGRNQTMAGLSMLFETSKKTQSGLEVMPFFIHYGTEKDSLGFINGLLTELLVAFGSDEHLEVKIDPPTDRRETGVY